MPIIYLVTVTMGCQGLDPVKTITNYYHNLDSALLSCRRQAETFSGDAINIYNDEGRLLGSVAFKRQRNGVVTRAVYKVEAVAKGSEDGDGDVDEDLD